MNYIGSKLKLSPFLVEVIGETVGELSDKTFCDLFAGTGIVGRTFKPRVRTVIANDIEHYSYVLNRHYIGNNRPLDASAYLRELDTLAPKEGFVYRHYTRQGHGERQYFSAENARKIDAVRMEIEAMRRSGRIDEDLYYLLLCSLIEAADKVANTASVYGAYLKKLKKSAAAALRLEAAKYDCAGEGHRVYREDANTLIRRIEGDILYLDPPYNHRQYGANYHLLNTLALYDDFVPRGKTGLRDYVRSEYCQRRKVLDAFEDLIAEARFPYIFLSYNNEGLMSAGEVREIMERYGEYRLRTIAYQRFKADRNENRRHKADATVEYLHILKKERI